MTRKLGDDINVPMGDDLRRWVEVMTPFQRKYCEYRGKGLNQPDSAKKAGSESKTRDGLGRVGYNIEATVAGAREYIAWLEMVRAKAACVEENEIIDGIRAAIRGAMDNDKYDHALKGLELLGTAIGMFGKNTGKASDTAEANKKDNKGLKNNIGAFKDDGESLEDRTRKLGAVLNVVHKEKE